MRFDNDNEYDDLPNNRRWNNKEGLFHWTIFILLLVLLAIFCWAGSYLIFSHPEKPSSYAILKKLKKLETPQKFELTAAPKGEFLDPKALLQRYGAMTPHALGQANAALLRNFIRNYKETRDLVPYITGTYNILDSFELTSNDFFTSGVIALAQATDAPMVLLENVFTADRRVVPILHRTLLTGLNIRLEKRFDLSALIHVERLPDGRMMFTTLPILYGSYASNHGPGSFSLLPPDFLNIKAGLPILTQTKINTADKTHAEYRRKSGLEAAAASPGPNAKKKPSHTFSTEIQSPNIEDQLVRIEKTVLNILPAGKVMVHNNPTASALSKKRSLTSTPTKSRKKTYAMPPTTVEEIKVARALPAKATLTATPFPSQPKATPESFPTTIKVALPSDSLAAVAEITPFQAPSPSTNTASLEKLSPSITNTTTPTPSPSPAAIAFTNVASGNWQTYEPGKMPLGRLMEPSDVQQLTEGGLADERIYLKGNFLVTASRANRAVLRSQSSTPLLGNSASKVRIIVEFPSNSKTPEAGSYFNRGAQRPFLITDVQKAPGGMVNVFVREITHD